MKAKLSAAVLLFAGLAVQAAHADQAFAYTETFTNPNDANSAFILSGTFIESDTGVLTNLSSTVLEHGIYTLPLDVVSISARHSFTSSNWTLGVPLQIDGYFIGLSGNRNTIRSCGQVLLGGAGCAIWQNTDPSVPPQGLEDVRTAGAGADGALLSDVTFVQTGALQLTAVPEPTTLALFLAGLGLLAAAGRRKNRVA